jgi:UDP-N-acetylmuramyl tripeptide synthase
LIGVSCQGEPGAAIQVEAIGINNGVSQFTMRVARGVRGTTLTPGSEMTLRLPLIGVTQVVNAAMAATAALLLGASPEAIRRGLASAHPIHRRMEVIRQARPLVIDDTVGNPRSLEAVFDTVRHLSHTGRLHVLFGIRGTRGPEINTRLAACLAERIKPYRAHLVVTASDDIADTRNTVLPAEREAFMKAFKRCANGSRFDFEPSLSGAVRTLLNEVGEDDVVLLLGAQGLDSAGPMVLQHLK